jgi:flagellar hook-basal body complex protein FliE
MMIAPIAPIGVALPIPPAAPNSPAPAGDGFANALMNGLQQVSGLEHRADAMIEDVAVGGRTQVHDVMVATTEAGLAVDMLVQVRDRAMEAYSEVTRMQL